MKKRGEKMQKEKIGIIGGSGLYEMKELKNKKEKKLKTPFGETSDSFILADLEGQEVVFLPRHGRGHRILPSEINYCANIFGMKTLGVTRIISVAAVGSMKQEIAPGHIVVPDQFYDLTRKRRSTFFGDGAVSHISFANPICSNLAKILITAGRNSGAHVHPHGTYICMEGPQFSTRAESDIHRKWGVDIIGMTNATEAKLAREAQICYSTLALATDYDCWYEGHDSVTVEAVIETLNKNVAMAQNIIKKAIANIPPQGKCSCGTALKHAVITDPKKIPKEVKKIIEVLKS